MASLNDYVKFMTEQFVLYVNEPKGTRLAKKREKLETKATFPYRMFGIIPYALAAAFKKTKSAEKR